MALRGLAIDSPTGNPYLLAGSAASLRLVLVNTGTRNDALTAITTSVAGGWGSYPRAAGDAAKARANAAASAAPASPSPTATVSPAAGGSQSVTIPAGNRVSYGVPDATRTLLLLGTKGRLYPGSTVRLTFTFTRAGEVTVSVPIQLSDTPGTETVEPAAGESEGG